MLQDEEVRLADADQVVVLEQQRLGVAGRPLRAVQVHHRVRLHCQGRKPCKPSQVSNLSTNGLFTTSDGPDSRSVPSSSLYSSVA